MQFQDKKITLTGASIDGFGGSLALCFAKLGAELYISARTLEKAQTTAAAVQARVPAARIHAFEVNTSSLNDIKACASAVQKMTGHIDILINNASYWLAGDISTGSDEEIAETINSTVTGVIYTTKYFLPLLKNSTCPDIINMNGSPALPGLIHATAHEAFAAAKAAQATFMNYLRERHRGSGLRICSIFPPNFKNISAFDETAWNTPKAAGSTANDYLTARNVFAAIQFALSQDRICSIDQIVLSNNSPA
ncbi:SDR family oxidoreductase [Undibacterium sp. TS12]|uniref:SDR family NAD(P)-dependent oxidoreductase n=1 Tax=Undibacterium sp. TS12 TaxID=2908202 RepID=UPI001F4CB09C|nr:SDR family oxidoreductase [Undibacterium sp. TS12]MCH8619436.1 SDR family oxidoreductase [Undibacterium sp. TS12]